MTISKDLREELVPSPYVEMYILDGRNINPELYFHFTPSSDTSFSFGGQEFIPFPIKGTGWEATSDQMPRPKLQIANVTKLVQPYLQQYQDLTKMKVTRIRTFAKFLDGQPTADSSQTLPAEVFYVNSMTRHDRAAIEFELVSVLDIPSIKLPRAQALKDDLNIYGPGPSFVKTFENRNMYAPGLTAGRDR